MPHVLDTIVSECNVAEQKLIRIHDIASELIGLVSFNCELDSDGICKSVRKNKDEKSFCCSECAKNKGFFEIIPKNDLDFYKENWNDDTGFFEKGRGCRLPYNFRSRGCLLYTCPDISLDKVESNILTSISSLLYR
jgi:hypothetical protein